jgi:hypothetical protein
MECCECEEHITTVSVTPPNVRYGCPSHRFRSVCKNGVTILQRKLEQQLIAASVANLSDQRLEEERVKAVEEQIKLAVEHEAALASRSWYETLGLKKRASRSSF